MQCREGKMHYSYRLFLVQPVPPSSFCVPQAVMSMCQRKTSPKTYHKNQSNTDGPKSTGTAVLCEFSNRGSLRHGSRFCRVKCKEGGSKGRSCVARVRWCSTGEGLESSSSSCVFRQQATVQQLCSVWAENS